MADDSTTTTDTTTTDTADPNGAATATDQPDTDSWDTSPGKGGKAAVLAELAEARKARKAAERELAKVQQASMTETERAVAEAEERGRAAERVALGQRLVRAEFRAQAAGKVSNLDELLDDLNLAKFIDEDGEPDAKAIAKAVARFTPTEPTEDTSRQPGPRPDLSQGGSRNHMALNSDDLTNAIKAAVGAT